MTMIGHSRLKHKDLFIDINHTSAKPLVHIHAQRVAVIVHIYAEKISADSCSKLVVNL